MWDLIVSVPDHCLSFYFPNAAQSAGTAQILNAIIKKNVLVKHRNDNHSPGPVISP